MHRPEIMAAARLLADARKTGKLEKLPLPVSEFPDAHLIQEEILILLDAKVGAYKVNGRDAGDATWGAIIDTSVKQSPASFSADEFPSVGIEGEIAFRLERDVMGGETLFTPDTFDRIVTPLAVLELVETRFTDYRAAAALDKAADFMSNGGLVVGSDFADWRKKDLGAIQVTMTVDGETVVSRVGGHSQGDPRLPAIAFLNSRNRRPLLLKGTILTTGAVTGLVPLKHGANVKVSFEGYGSAEATFA